MRSSTVIKGLLAVLSLVVVLGACAPAQAVTTATSSGERAAVAGPRKIKTVMMSDPTGLSKGNPPGGAGLPGQAQLNGLLIAGLTTVDGRGVRHPQLAEAVPTVENGLWRVFPDGRMETEWKIRPGATWHDGTPLTAPDFVFTAQVDQDRELAAARDVAYESVESVRADGTDTVVVLWRRPFIQADGLFSSPIPKHLVEELYADKASFASQPFWTRHFVGTGPYRVREWVPSSHMILTAFDGYVLGRPKIDEIEIRFIVDPRAVAANLLAGEVELTLGKNLALEQAQAIRDQWRLGKIEIGYANPIIIHPQLLNPDPAIVSDARFRSALVRAVDRQEMVETLMAGASVVADRLFHPSRTEYDAVQSAVVLHPYDPRRAEQIIAELGYVRGADGVQQDTSGRRLGVEIRIQPAEIQEKAMYATAAFWQRVGLEVQTIVVPTQQSQDAEYMTTFPSFRLLRGDPTAWDRMRISSIPLPENSFRGNNYNRYRSPELEALISRYYVTIPAAERMDVVRQLVQHVTGALNIMPLFFDAEPMFISGRITGVETGQTWNAHTWDLQPAP